MRLFYNGRCIKAISKGKIINIKTSDKILIAKYKFDCSKANLFPEFNEGFEYTYIDEQEQQVDVMTVDTETIVLMTYNAEPDEYGILTTEVEVETPRLANAGDIITRSIYSEELPTQISFGHRYINDEYEKNESAKNRANSLLEVDYLNTSNLSTMKYMFRFCHNVKAINAKWNTNKVTNMNSVFSGCMSLTSLDLSSWNTNKVTNMNYMLGGLRSVKKIMLDNFNFNTVTEMIGFMSSANTELDYIKVYNINAANKITPYLPDRTSKTTGLIECEAGTYDNLNIEEIKAKNWEFRILETSYFILGKSKLGQDKLK